MPSYDLIAQAASGSIDITGPHDDPAARRAAGAFPSATSRPRFTR